MPVVTLVNEGKTIDAAEGTNLRKLLLENGISPYIGKDRFLNCFGNGLCGTCRVEVVDGKGASALSSMEELAIVGLTPLYAREVPKNVRLSCQIHVTKEISIKTYPKVGIDKKLTQERLTMLAIWIFFGGVLGWVVVRMLLEIATGA